MAKIRYIFFFCILVHCSLIGQVEICDNGIDDDGDNSIDLNDSDCDCQQLSSVSLIPNPSFEDLDCCPDDRGQIYCATDWGQASAPTTDFIHLCGWSGFEDLQPPMPFPDGEGILGFRDGRISSSDPLDAFWKEYAGACLISPMKADSIYRIAFDIGFINSNISPPINVSIFGTTNCDFLPFGSGDVTFGCPSNSPDWIKMGDVLVSGGSGNTWINSFIDIFPDTDIQAIAIGPDCDPIPSNTGIYYFFDNLFLADFSSFDLRIRAFKHPCDQNFVLSVPEDTDFQYQWYLSGVALAGEVFSEMTSNYGEGSYQVRILSETLCRVSAPYEYTIPSFETADTISICIGDILPFGDENLTVSGSYFGTFQTQNNCDSTVALNLKVIGEKYDTIEVTVAPDEIFVLGGKSFDEEGEFSLSFTSSLGCDSLLLLKLSHFNVFIPNVFSPNEDGINDLFQPFYPPNDVVSYEMKIFDRWGNLVYQGDVWDGGNLSTDVFVYSIQVQFVNGESTIFYDSVTLLR